MRKIVLIFLSLLLVGCNKKMEFKAIQISKNPIGYTNEKIIIENSSATQNLPVILSASDTKLFSDIIKRAKRELFFDEKESSYIRLAGTMIWITLEDEKGKTYKATMKMYSCRDGFNNEKTKSGYIVFESKTCQGSFLMQSNDFDKIMTIIKKYLPQNDQEDRKKEYEKDLGALKNLIQESNKKENMGAPQPPL